MSATSDQPVIKSCPFCGGTPTKHCEALGEHCNYANEITYRCACGCSMATRSVAPGGRGYADNSRIDEQALDAWNRRFNGGSK